MHSICYPDSLSIFSKFYDYLMDLWKLKFLLEVLSLK